MEHVLIYYEDWLNESILMEKFDIGKDNILLRYDNFIKVAIDQHQKKELDLSNVTYSCFPKKILNEDIVVDNKVWITRFSGPIKTKWVDKLKEFGIQLYGYCDQYSMYAYMGSDMVKMLRKNGFYMDDEKVIDGIDDYNTKTKICEGCSDNIVVHYFPWRVDGDLCCIMCTKDCCIEDLADCEDVMFIEPYITPTICGDTVEHILRTDIMHVNGITGSSELIAITDTGIYADHELFDGKLVDGIDMVGDVDDWGGDGYGHGTHVAGSAAVDDAKLISVKVFDNNGKWAVNGPGYSFWSKTYNKGSRINNNSWGISSNGNYLPVDREADRVCWDNFDYVLIVAAGNDGSAPGTIGSPAVAKNVITVGACVTSRPYDVASFSSHGPTKDGRIKPDVLSPGTAIRSAKSQTRSEYINSKGTSMATPHISVCVSLIRQYLKNYHHHSIGPNGPSSALIKALLINGAVEVNGSDADSQKEVKYPNNSQGWGRVDLSRSIPINTLDRRIYMWDISTTPHTGSKWVNTFRIASSKMVKITLTWLDPPSSPSSKIVLTNNLILRVVSPNGKIFMGNNFTGMGPGYSVPGGKLDNINNVQGVHLLSGYSFGLNLPIPKGVYIVEVIASNVTATDKGFALVVGVDPIKRLIPRIAIIGDYDSQLTKLVQEMGYKVDNYSSGDYSGVIANNIKYNAIIINTVNDSTQFDELSKIAQAVIFLGTYSAKDSGLAVLSRRIHNPKNIHRPCIFAPLKMKIKATHDIFLGYTKGDIITLIDGGTNDFQTYDKIVGGKTIGSNAMDSGLYGIIGVQNSPRWIVISCLGIGNCTNTTHWTEHAKTIFTNSVAWAVNKLYNENHDECNII